MERTATRSESLLRPREIQVRIRAGQSPETVAAAAQTTVDRVMAFATPVLAERAFVAQQAAKSSVRRRAGDGPGGLLGEAVGRRLEAAGLDPDAADWDAWRREDGRWTVVAAYVEAGEDQRAEFTYDAIGRYVIAEDDLARWLVGERRATEPATPSPSTAIPSPSPVALVPETAAGQLALGDDALQVVTGRPLAAVPRPTEPAPAAPSAPAAAAADEPTDLPADLPAGLPAELLVGSGEPTEDLTETARAVRAAGATAAAPVPAREPSPSPAAQEAAEGDVLFEDTGLRTPPEPAAERRPTRQAAGSRSRRSMPSWDDIMLGSAPRGD